MRRCEFRTMRSARQSRPSRGRRVAERLLAVLVALDAALRGVDLAARPVQARRRQACRSGSSRRTRCTCSPLLGLAWCALTWRNRRSWLGLAPEHTLHLRGVHPLAWLILPLSAALLGAQLLAATEQVLPVTRKVRKSARIGPAKNEYQHRQPPRRAAGSEASYSAPHRSRSSCGSTTSIAAAIRRRSTSIRDSC